MFRNADRRSGLQLVEFAVCFPVFLIFLFGFIEFGHIFMVIHSLNASATMAARSGISEDASTADVVARAEQIIGASVDVTLPDLVVMVKDGSVFDDPNVNPKTIDVASLPDVEVRDLDPRDLFLVRIEVPYDKVGILGPRWMRGKMLDGQSIMRKE